MSKKEIVKNLRDISNDIASCDDLQKWLIFIPENSEGIVTGQCTKIELAGMIHFLADMLE